MTNKIEYKTNAEMVKIMLHLMRAKEADVIVDAFATYNELLKPINDQVMTAKRNYDELTRQIEEIESGEGTTFN